MDEVLLHLLGYLTEAQWIDALSQAPGLLSRSKVKDLAKQIDAYYPSLGWTDKTREKLGLPTT